jgi:sulfoxide reductase heme-binding subunit YedZ
MRAPPVKNVPWALYAFVAVAASVLALVHLGRGVDEAGLALFARHTARLAFVMFLPAFVAGPFAYFRPTPAARRMLRLRRHLGLAFALAHFIHLGALVSYFVLTPAEPAAVAIAFGGFGYLLLVAMTLTSTDRAMSALGRNWKRLHGFGVCYLWFVFAQSYLGRVVGGGGPDAPANASPPIVYVLLLGFALAALALRGARFCALRRPRPGAAPGRGG